MSSLLARRDVRLCSIPAKGRSHIVLVGLHLGLVVWRGLPLDEVEILPLLQGEELCTDDLEVRNLKIYCSRVAELYHNT